MGDKNGLKAPDTAKSLAKEALDGTETFFWVEVEVPEILPLQGKILNGE